MNQNCIKEHKSHNLPDRMSYLSHADTQHLAYCGQLTVARSFTQLDTNNVPSTENTKTDACPKITCNCYRD